MNCPKCKGTGVIETGNNDLPCDCPAGDEAKFNVAGRGTVTGRQIKEDDERRRRTPIDD
jgi:hypothetical protein